MKRVLVAILFVSLALPMAVHAEGEERIAHQPYVGSNCESSRYVIGGEGGCTSAGPLGSEIGGEIEFLPQPGETSVLIRVRDATGTSPFFDVWQDLPGEPVGASSCGGSPVLISIDPSYPVRVQLFTGMDVELSPYGSYGCWSTASLSVHAAVSVPTTGTVTAIFNLHPGIE